MELPELAAALREYERADERARAKLRPALTRGLISDPGGLADEISRSLSLAAKAVVNADPALQAELRELAKEGWR